MTAPSLDSVAALDFTPTCEATDCTQPAVWFGQSCCAGYFMCTPCLIRNREIYDSATHHCGECSRFAHSFVEAFPKVVLLP